MTTEERALIAEIERRITAKRMQTWCPHLPTEKQSAFLVLTCLEALFGGAAGGGKSDALLMAALQYVDRPNYSALIIRRTYADLSLPGAIMDRAAEWLRPTSARWAEREKRWTFPSGSTLTFGYLESENDKYRYQGAELQYLGIDELTQIPESQYVYLLSRLRRSQGSDVPLRARGATNPGGTGHDWVKARFVAESTRRGDFIPSRVSDNPHVDQIAYLASLDRLDEMTRRQLRDGEWVRDSGGLIYTYSPDRNAVQDLPRLDDDQWSYIWGADFGSSERAPTTAIAIMAYAATSPDVYLVESAKFAGLTVSDLAERYRSDEARIGGFEHVIGDQGGLGGGYLLELQQRHNIPITGVEKQNKLGYRKLFGDDLRRGRVKVLDHANAAWIDEVNGLSWDAKGIDAQPGQPDHCSDAVLYLWREARHWTHVPAEKPKTTEQKISDFWAKTRREIAKRNAKKPLSISRV